MRIAPSPKSRPADCGPRGGERERVRGRVAGGEEGDVHRLPESSTQPGVRWPHTLPPTRTHAARLPLVAHATAHAHATHLTPFSDSVNRHG